MRWGVRLLGILSMVVLVRLLESKDFGLIAMVMAIVALIDQLTDFGITWALVRDKRAGRVQFDTAWTIRQGQMFLVAAIAIAAAPATATFYDDPRVTPLLQVIALSFLIRGFENIGIVEFQRQLQFHRDFTFRVLLKVLGVTGTICLAFWLKSYWALALGMLLNAIIGVILSYWLSPYRPRWTLAAWREIWGFSQWILSQGVAKYIYENGPILFLGRATSAEFVGYYSVSNEIAALPATEISQPVSRAVLPGFAKLVDEKDRLKAGYLKALAAVAAVTLPLGLGMACVAPELVKLVLGDKWLPAISLIQILAIFASMRALDSLAGNLLMVLDKPKSFAAITWAQALLLALTIYPAFMIASLDGVAFLRAALSFVGLGLFIEAISRYGVARKRDVVRVLLRPLLAALLMAAVLVTVDPLVAAPETGTAIQLAIALFGKTVIGAAAYSVFLLTAWTIAGKPDGLEAMVIAKLRNIARRII